MRFMKITLRDMIRPIAGLFAIQPVVVGYMALTGTLDWSSYLNTGWGLQIAITIYLIFFYAWFEGLPIEDFFNEDPQASSEDPEKSDSIGSFQL